MAKENEKPNNRTPRPPSSSKNRELTIYLKSGNSFSLLFKEDEYKHLRQNYSDYISGKKTEGAEYESQDGSILQIFFDQIEAIVAVKK
jgi:hypothetical protein